MWSTVKRLYLYVSLWQYSEVIIQRRPDENRADDEDTETVVKSIVSENVHDYERIPSENCIEDKTKTNWKKKQKSQSLQ